MKKTLFLFMLLSSKVYATQETTEKVTIDRVTVYDQNGAVMIHTEPRHSIEGTTCTGDFWIRLDTTDPNYQTMLSLILSAQASRASTDVTVTDEFGETNCYLSRITLRYDY